MTDPATIQARLSTLELQLKDVEAEMKTTKSLGELVRDCKLKWQQIGQQEASLIEFAKDEDEDSFLMKKLKQDRKKCEQTLDQNKKQIEYRDTKKLVKSLFNESDCEAALEVLKEHHADLVAKRDRTYGNAVVHSQAQLKQAIAEGVKGGSSEEDAFHAQFQGEWSHSSLDKFTAFEFYKKHRIDDVFDHQISKYLQTLRGHTSIKIRNCDIVHCTNQLRLFNGAIDTLEKRMGTGLFNANLGAEKDSEQRDKVLNSLRASKMLAKHNRNEKLMIIGGFHGTTSRSAESIIKTGFANLAKLDDGWFGKGIYFTTHPEYLINYHSSLFLL